MNLCFFLSLSLGAIVVIQPTINRLIGDHQGMAMAAWINGIVLFLSTGLLFLIVWSFPDRFPSGLHLKSGAGFRLWYFLPGLMGLCLVLLVPLTMKNIGAFPTVIAMLAGQIATSFFIDIAINNQAFSASRGIGLFLALTGAYLSFRPVS
jgi:uncharacterized membrane protein YdcZ (DUF606 family)